MLILLWVAYYTRTFLFTYCPSQARPCGAADYYNDPGDALAHDPTLTVDEILFINSAGDLYYHRPMKSTDCVPGSNQTVYLAYPQYCQFNGDISGVWKETAFNSNIYRPVGFTGPDVTTLGNCQPDPGQAVTSGVTLLRWDPNPFQ